MKSGSRQKAILVLYLSESTFVKTDIEIISAFAPVLKYHFKRTRSLQGIFYQYLHQLLFLISTFRKVDVVYSWFNDYHTVLPVLFAKIFGKKSVIISGGFDAKGLPELSYGIFRKKGLRASFAKFSYRNASLIAPVDSSLIESINYYIDPEGVKGGVRNFIPGIRTKFKVIPTGYDPEIWKKQPLTERTDSVISVASIKDHRTFQIKGFDFLIEIARDMPGIPFILIGFSEEMRKKYSTMVSPNVQLLPFIPNRELIEYYSKSKVYAQFSLTEGLPNSLCEAMLCECIPVGSAVDGIPNAIGECGFILDSKDAERGKQILEKSLNSEPSLGLKARNRIIKLFPLQKREELLQTVILSLKE